MNSGDSDNLAPIHAVDDVDPGDGSSPTETAGSRDPVRGLHIPGQPDGASLFRRLFERERDVRVLRAVLEAREEALGVLMARLVDAEKMCARLSAQEQASADLREEIRRLADVRDREVKQFQHELLDLGRGVDQGTERLLAARERERMLGEEVRRLTEERDEALDSLTRTENLRILRYTKPLRTIWAYCRWRLGIQPE